MIVTGKPIQVKKPKMNGKPYKEKQVVMKTFQEYYIPEYEEQVDFLKQFAVNFETFKWDKFIRNMKDEPMLDLMEKEKPSLVDASGKEL